MTIHKNLVIKDNLKITFVDVGWTGACDQVLFTNLRGDYIEWELGRSNMVFNQKIVTLRWCLVIEKGCHLEGLGSKVQQPKFNG
jgi:hypothetical protein